MDICLWGNGVLCREKFPTPLYDFDAHLLPIMKFNAVIRRRSKINFENVCSDE